MRKLLFLLGILLVWMPNLVIAQKFEFALNGIKVRYGILDVYLNTDDFSPFESIPEFEGIMVENFAYVNQIPTSSVWVNYKGRTTLPCDDLRDGVVVFCFKKLNTGGGLTTRMPDREHLLADASVYIDNVPNFSRQGLEWFVLHELFHVLGLNHYEGGKSITGQGVNFTRVMTAYDYAAITHLYPFDLDRCEVRLGPDLKLDLPYIWGGNTQYHGTLQLNKFGEFEVISGGIQEAPVSECGYKFIESTGEMYIASVWYDSLIPAERGRYFLNLKLKSNPSAISLPGPPVFEVVSAGIAK